MSINMLQQKEKTLLTAISKLDKDLASEQKKVSNSDKKIADSQKIIGQTKNASTIRSKEQIILRETKNSNAAKQKIADISGKIAKKKKNLVILK